MSSLIKRFYNRYKRKKNFILRDVNGYYSYRRDVYGDGQREPIASESEFRLFWNLFKNDLNGFRSLFYYRIGGYAKYLRWLYPLTSNLVLDIGEIDLGGCMFHHAFSSYLNAEHVGYKCSFRKNTTIGNKLVGGKNLRPYLEDHVFVGPNIVIIGGIRIVSHALIGAGSVATKDVPPYCVVAGNPAIIIKDNRNLSNSEMK